MPAAQSTKAEFKATTSIWDFCPEPFKTDFNIFSLDSRSETTSLSLDIFSWLKSVLSGSGQKSHIDVVALNAALVLWAAGIEDDLNEGFNKALFSIYQGDPWKKFLLLKNYLSTN